MLFTLSDALTTLSDGILKSTELLDELKDFDLIVHDSLAILWRIVW